MPYVLVILRRGQHVENDELHELAHQRFITSLIKENVVLLGGGFADQVNRAYGRGGREAFTVARPQKDRVVGSEGSVLAARPGSTPR